MLNGAQVIIVRQTYLQKLAQNSCTFFKAFRKGFFRLSFTKSEQSDRFQPGNILKIIKHVSYSISYYKISLLVYSMSSNLSNGRPIFTHPAYLDPNKVKIIGMIIFGINIVKMISLGSAEAILTSLCIISRYLLFRDFRLQMSKLGNESEKFSYPSDSHDTDIWTSCSCKSSILDVSIVVRFACGTGADQLARLASLKE